MPRLPKAFYIKLGFYQQHPSHDLLYIIDYINCMAEIWEIQQKFTSSEKYIKKDIGARGGISLRAPIIRQGWMSKNNVIIR